MLNIYNIKEKQEFLREVAILTQKEWGSKTNSEEEFRGKGYSKILNNAILEESKKRGFKKLYLKTDLSKLVPSEEVFKKAQQYSLRFLLFFVAKVFKMNMAGITARQQKAMIDITAVLKIIWSLKFKNIMTADKKTAYPQMPNIIAVVFLNFSILPVFFLIILF